MEKNNDRIDLMLTQLREVKYPHSVDVTDKVMASLNRQPMKPFVVKKQRNWFRYVATVAACAALLIAVNVTLLYTRNYDEAGIGNMISEVYGYESNGSGVVEETTFSQAWFDNSL